MAIDAIYPSLKDKTVLITGGGSGIGEALTRAFIAQSAKVGFLGYDKACLLYTSPSPRDSSESRIPSSA